MSMFNLGSPASAVPQDGLTRVIRRLEDLERRVREMNSQTVSTGTIQSTNFDGNASTGNPGTQGYGLDGPTGNAAIGSLFLRPGSITNAALLDPAEYFVVDQRNSGTFTVGNSSFLVQTVTVPAGFSRAYIHVSGVANLQSPTSATNVSCFIKSSPGAIQSDASSSTVPTGANGNAASNLAQSASGVSGTFTLSLWAGVSTSVPAFSCFASLTGLVVFLR
jgi:hypothetical protein